MERCECCDLLSQPGVELSYLGGITVCGGCIEYAIESVWGGDDPRATGSNEPPRTSPQVE